MKNDPFTARDDVPDEPIASAPPRAFAQGTGVLLQTVGMVFLLATCCTCSMTFLWDPLSSRALQGDAPPPAYGTAEAFRAMLADPGKSGLMLTIVSLNLGGLALAVFGLGLQAEKRRAAWGAMATLIALTLALVVAGIGLWQGDATIQARAWHGLVLLVTLALWGFVIAALRQVIASPPPGNAEVLPPDYKIPYSMYHDDPPAVRMAQDIGRRRAKLQAEQAELDQLERELKSDDLDKPDSARS